MKNIKAELEIVRMDNADVLTASGDNPTGPIVTPGERG